MSNSNRKEEASWALLKIDYIIENLVRDSNQLVMSVISYNINYLRESTLIGTIVSLAMRDCALYKEG